MRDLSLCCTSCLQTRPAVILTYEATELRKRKKCWEIKETCTSMRKLFSGVRKHNIIIIIIIIISRHSSMEHRALTKFRSLTRFRASALISFHVLPCCLISSRIVLRHVVRGVPRDLVPWGFHSKAAFVMSPGGRRNVCPSDPHFLCRISSSIDFCLALVHSSWFYIWTGQNIFSIVRMHVLTRTWSRCMMVLVSPQFSQS